MKKIQMNLNPSHLEIDKLMQSMPVEWRYRWCESEVCACIGCCNRGPEGLLEKGYTRGDWEWWKVRHPEPRKDKYGKYVKGDIE